MLSYDSRHTLAITYTGLNPILLWQQLDENLNTLWDLAQPPGKPSHRMLKKDHGYTQL